MPDHFVDCLLEAGFDVMSVANNHVNDFGSEGRAATAALLDSVGLAYAGFITHPYTLFEKGGITYGFAAFAPNRGTMDLKNYRRAAEITRHLDSLADIVIISFHGGGEGKDHQHVVRGDEEYLGYNRGSVYRFSHDVIDAGADIVFGHGPHVTRALELYKGRLICYSLGNFATYRRFNLRGPNGIAPIIKVDVNRQGEFLSGEVVSTYQPGEGGARIDPSNRALHKLIELTEADFPETDLEIGMDGRIRRKIL
jgi:poly-gamma-glutamate capsule biosynthesis protein CapA/YwtB (metallophosphatase superfamily)